MKSQTAAIVFTLLAAWTWCCVVLSGQTAPHPAAPSALRSVWDGVYSEEQAKRGGSLYYGICAACHGEKLKGNESTPALTGSDFAADWEGQTLGDLFKKIRRTMPKNQPGRLNQQQD